MKSANQAEVDEKILMVEGKLFFENEINKSVFVWIMTEEKLWKFDQ